MACSCLYGYPRWCYCQAVTQLRINSVFCHTHPLHNEHHHMGISQISTALFIRSLHGQATCQFWQLALLTWIHFCAHVYAPAARLPLRRGSAQPVARSGAVSAGPPHGVTGSSTGQGGWGVILMCNAVCVPAVFSACCLQCACWLQRACCLLAQQALYIAQFSNLQCFYL